ncbi:cation diffusion facilitator family transporter [Roseomonas fluvialis]|uniref:Cation diffusion facilitator transporter n=1 Tax=Roseomonas fluvialis TaxID=1750527 RepID=A0ABM7Y684_9PROT|nr:cation transporter [Roseomonas fluvialis]BDG73426.1 cation diffusion facilitator transporter [Roseomonas fluvialis]
MRNEQTILKASISVTICVAAFGITFGIVSGSSAIAFDGAYSLMDAGMSVLALVVARLITGYATDTIRPSRLRDRFSVGFWHLEPIVLGTNGVLLMGVSAYALITAIGKVLAGGNTLVFDYAIIYAVVTLLACLAMASMGRWANRTIRSEFIALDVTAWLMSAGITAALLVAFVAGQMIEGTRLDWLTPYIDPAVLAVVCLVLIPMPIPTVRRALSDILLMTPETLKAHVDAVAAGVVARQGFLSYRAYVAKVGRSTQIEIYFIVPPGAPPRSIEDWDSLRDEIGEAIGDESPNRWLTIVFTADAEWAD